MKARGTTIIILLISITLQGQSWWNSKKIKGNGNLITTTRTIDTFDAVSIGGSFDVVLIDGKEGKVTIEGEENIIPYLITEVRGGKLKIKFKDNVNVKFNRGFTVTVPFEEINGISIGGSGDVKSKKTIKTEDLSFSIGGSGQIDAVVDVSTIKASIGGSGDILLSGQTKRLKSSIAGSGNIKAYELETNEVKASIAGSGSVYISVKDNIKASVVGSGSVYYKGEPTYVDVNSIGSGDVIKKD